LLQKTQDFFENYDAVSAWTRGEERLRQCGCFTDKRGKSQLFCDFVQTSIAHISSNFMSFVVMNIIDTINSITLIFIRTSKFRVSAHCSFFVFSTSIVLNFESIP